MADDSSDNEDDGVVACSPPCQWSTVGYNGGRVRVRFLIFPCVYRPSKTFQGDRKSPGDYVDDTPPEKNPARGCPKKKRDICPGRGPDPTRTSYFFLLLFH